MLGGEQSLDYSYWCKQLDQNIGAKKSGMMNTVTVKKMRRPSNNV